MKIQRIPIGVKHLLINWIVIRKWELNKKMFSQYFNICCPHLQETRRPNSITVSINSTDPDGQSSCKCKTDCKTLRCKCRKNGSSCSDSCGCPEDCVNISAGSNNSSLKRETSTQSTNGIDDEPHTPKKTRLLQIWRSEEEALIFNCDKFTDWLIT